VYIAENVTCTGGVSSILAGCPSKKKKGATGRFKMIATSPTLFFLKG